MRISDDRYHRERQQMDLAMRMLRHEARTAMIQSWTGLSADRVRKLHREYGLDRGSPLKRHRGKPPRQAVFFLRNADVRRQAIVLGGLYALLGLYDTVACPEPVTGMPTWAGVFCEAYETYLSLGVGTALTFEHAAFLLEALRRRVELQPAACPTCQAFTILDTQRRGSPQCPLCDTGLPRRGRSCRNPPRALPSCRRARIAARTHHDTPFAPPLRRTLP